MSVHLREAWRALAYQFSFGGDAVGDGQYNGYLVAWDGDKKAGYLDWSVWGGEPGVLNIRMIEVMPEYRGRGLAQTLLDRVIEDQFTKWGEPAPKVNTGMLTDEGSAWWQKVRHKYAAAQTVTLYHGTNQAALDSIRRDGHFKQMSPEIVNHAVEERYGLPYDSVWRHKYNTFSHGRATDPHVYFSGAKLTAKGYAHVGSEVIWDALNAVVHILFWDEIVDENGDYRPEKVGWRKDWIRAEIAKHYRSVVLTLEVPWEKVKADQAQIKRIDTSDWEIEEFSGDDWNTMMLLPPIPASWIVAVETTV